MILVSYNLDLKMCARRIGSLPKPNSYNERLNRFDYGEIKKFFC